MRDTLLIVKSIWSGLKCLRHPVSTYRWMRNAMDEYHMTWLDMLGVLFMNDYRLAKHWERQDTY